MEDSLVVLHRPVESTVVCSPSRQAAIGPECVKTYVKVHHIQLASWANRRNALTNIIIVEFTAFDELEAMAGIKAIRRAFFESTNFNRERSRIRLFENLCENSRAYP
ncbi:hypothetical protein D3C76_1491430 [compost metagenome]